MELRSDKIKAPIRDNMALFEKKFKQSMKSEVPLLETITGYIVKRKGKQLRPMFVFLSAKLFGEINESTYRAAALIELLHTATLVHDDVVDDSHERRGFFSVNALWKNKIAVLIGDYLLSKGLLLSLDNDDFQLLKIVSRAVREMSEGELLQIEKARRLDISEEIYFEIIQKKTASLIAACCAAGAYSVSGSSVDEEKMYQFGAKVGMAFQIKDDLFDLGEGTDIGKPMGIDIKEKKMTLPLIHALSKSGWREKRSIVNIVRKFNGSEEKVDEVISFIRRNGGIEYAKGVMEKFRDEALSMLSSLPVGDARNSLEDLVCYTIERSK